MSRAKSQDNVEVDVLDNDELKFENTEYPVLALRDMVVFPGNTASLFIGRSISLKAANAAYQYNTPLLLLTQKEADKENPEEKDLYEVGTLAVIKRYVVMPDGTLNLAVEGIRRVKVEKLNMFKEYYTAMVAPFDIKEDGATAEEINAMMAIVIEQLKKQTLNMSKMPKEDWFALNAPSDVKQVLVVVKWCRNYNFICSF